MIMDSVFMVKKEADKFQTQDVNLISSDVIKTEYFEEEEAFEIDCN